MKTFLLTALICTTTASSVLLVQAQSPLVIPPGPRAGPPPSVFTPSPTPPLWLNEIVMASGNTHAAFRAFANLDTMHDAYFADFARKPGFGSGRMMYLPPADHLTLNGETYRFTTPDLLGLENEPLAYVRPPGQSITMNVVSKKELRARLQRRTLSADELNAVLALRAGQNLVSMPKPVTLAIGRATDQVNGMLVVGALRATAQCAECHQVKEGTLLGAFSYTLVPTNPEEKPAATITNLVLNGIQLRTISPTTLSLLPSTPRLHVTTKTPGIGATFSVINPIPVRFPSPEVDGVTKSEKMKDATKP